MNDAELVSATLRGDVSVLAQLVRAYQRVTVLAAWLFHR